MEIATVAEAEKIIKDGMMWQGKKGRVCLEAEYTRAVLSNIVKNRDGEIPVERKKEERKPVQQIQSQPSGDRDNTKLVNPPDQDRWRRRTQRTISVKGGGI